MPLVAAANQDVLNFLGLRVYLVFDIVHICQDRKFAVELIDLSVIYLTIVEQRGLIWCIEFERACSRIPVILPVP